MKNKLSFDVMVIGAGAAGLAAFRELDRAGKRLLCLEARDRIGGRILTVHDPLSPIPIELGAEFVHGRSPEIWDIAASAPLAIYSCMEHAVHVRNGKPRKKQDAWLQIEEVMKDLEAAVKTGRDQTFSEFLEKSSYSADTKELAISYVEGFNAARREVISIASLVKDQKAADEIDGDRAFRLMNGYDAVLHWMLDGVRNLENKLRLNSEVRSIQWTSDGAAVEFASTLTGAVHSISARHVIVTVPLGVLQAQAIRFHPEPVDTLHAAKQLQFGQVIRVILRFQKPIWEENKEFAEAGFILSNEKHFPTWWTTLPVRARSITAWSSGPHADELLESPKPEIIQYAIHDLSRILGVSERKLAELLETVYFHDWHGDLFARGAYSYVPAHAMGVREILARPVAGTLYFAGEAAETNGHSATVHGAIASGRMAAQQILQS
ncbi:MAG: FAD-dependent oxidoreductase [Acidobacteriaceae bacterium]|nr:FAD-dependent oxidoreductase [Acidobacteriaceae bacterium]